MGRGLGHVLTLSSDMHSYERLLQGRRSVVNIGGPKLFISILLFSFVYIPSPSPPLPLEVGPLKCSQGSGQRGKVGSPSRNRFFYVFSPKNLTSSCNDSNDFSDKKAQQSLTYPRDAV